MNRKKLVILTIFLMSFLCFKSSNAQITLDNIVTPHDGIGFDFYTVDISPTETKYLFEDTVTNTLSLYNMDFTPFMLNIAVPEPFGLWTHQVLYVSRSLFDCDSTNIEYVYESPTIGTNTFYIMRTDGTQLFRLDSANGPYCLGGCLGMSDIIQPIRNTSAGAKLFLQRPNTQNIYIYSLCGTLTTDPLGINLRNNSYVTVFPNPTSHLLTFKINPPDNINNYELVIVDNNAKEARREKIEAGNDKYVIDISGYNSGTYFYSLCTKNKSCQTGKFIITK